MIAPGETAQIYQHILLYIEKVTQTDVILSALPIISDMGSGLHSAFFNNPKHYLCHHHLIKTFGASSKAGHQVRKILDLTISKDIWENNRLKRLDIIKIAHESAIQTNNPSPFGNHYSKLVEMLEDQQLSNQRTVYPISKWATFARMNDHVPRTQNFSESCHSHINRYYKELRSGYSKGMNNFYLGITCQKFQ